MPMSDEDLRLAAEGATCSDCGHTHSVEGCTGPPTASDLWAGVLPSICDCMDAALSAPTHTEDEGVGR